MGKQVTFNNPFWSNNFPDPFVLKVRGRYYAYGTEGEKKPAQGTLVFPILTSTNLLSWREVGRAMPALGGLHHSYWAPEVTVYNDKFLMYYSVHLGEEFIGSIRVAIADSPEGPFIDSGHDLTKTQIPWAIDPHIFRDGNGQSYLYMTIEYLDASAGLVGSGNAVDRLLDPFTLEGKLTRVTPPSQSWQLFEAQRATKGDLDWYTVEGPTVLRHRRKYYEMFSGGCYYRDNYAINYATSDVPMGAGGLRDTSWQDWQGRTGHVLLIQGNRHVLSPGHNSLVLSPNNAEQYIAYHALQANMLERYACLDRLFWHGDEMWTNAPTYTPQPVPPLPRLHELFDAPQLNNNWQAHGGTWNITQDAVVQSDELHEAALLAQQELLHTDWLLEVNLRLLSGDGAYGVVFGDSANPSYRLTITSDAQLEWANEQEQGDREDLSYTFPSPQRVRETPAVSLHPSHFPSALTTIDLKAWHQLIITVSGSVCTVQFDGIGVMETVLHSTLRSFALFTERCSAAFSGISLTDHFRDEFLNDAYTPALLGWHVETEHAKSAGDNVEDWRVQNGALEQGNSAPGTHILLKGSQYEFYECGATMKFNRGDESAALGLVLWLNESDKCFLWLTHNESKGSTLLVEGTGTLANQSVQHELPQAFDLHDWHTLRITNQQGSLTCFLDGPGCVTLTLPSHAYKMGLATRNTAASFTGVWQTG